ncbi:high affinity immunoglobulin gamma Fc receptor I-like [Melanotaenia boesemani]|uniref:high affinity immunoglobulin gamma Fc receptor I-like n=1 Tax=Melanotaenia boesemani TaxID=1250792 RepID=UPI001C04E97E|nr:high affinity immunoglobulin gamma Fc receptor I-like [Melanotaenia boesemani]
MQYNQLKRSTTSTMAAKDLPQSHLRRENGSKLACAIEEEETSRQEDSMEATALCTRLWISMLLLLVAEVKVFCDAQEVDGSVVLEGPLHPVMVGESVTFLCRNKRTSSNSTAEFYKNNMLISSSDEATMIIHSVSKSDAGPYKCKISGAGESQEKWLFVVDGLVLDGPTSPVTEGDSVTLHCRNNKDPTKSIADFYRHGVHIHTGYDGKMTIPRVSKADEGPYQCSISGFGESAETRLVVRVLPLWFLMVTKVQDNCYAQRIYADFPDVTPNTAQHFEYQSLYFSCERFDLASGWRVMRKIPGENGSCGMSWGVFNGSFCIVRNIYVEDSGHYWCETVDGKKSNSVNITVTAGAVALESPVLPVMEGDVVTLRCKNKTPSSHVSAGFYKNGFLVKNVTTGTLSIHKASKLDEGLYKCYIPGAGGSPESWLAVSSHFGMQRLSFVRIRFLSFFTS